MPKFFLATLAGLSVFLSFESFSIVPLIFFFPYLFNQLSESKMALKESFLWGFFTSFIIMLGGFYWIIYVLHEFGPMPWAAAVVLYLCFCGFGALNFPLFLSLATYWNQKLRVKHQSPFLQGLWVSLGLPALFTLTEFFIPKLFPWYIGHCFYRQLWLIQIVEITGSTYLSFVIYSLGGTLGAVVFNKKIKASFLALPLLLFIVPVAFSMHRLTSLQPVGRSLKVALIQANIGNLEKVASRTGILSKVAYVVDQHLKLTEEILPSKPDLIVWPETALPFQLDGNSPQALRVRQAVQKWKTTLIAGGYSQSVSKPWKDYNTAFFLEPKEDGTLRIEKYFKIILLAFGEYLPLGEYYPKIYRWFPQIGGFERGTSREPFVLADGTRLGINICYEAILPEFYRRGAVLGVHGVINLTNDSWFGPTSEPYLHGSLTVFRAIETRAPLFRVTNTGTSFSVDVLGRLSELTPVYKEATTVTELRLPKAPIQTVYLAYGDWVVGLYSVLFISLLGALWKRRNN